MRKGSLLGAIALLALPASALSSAASSHSTVSATPVLIRVHSTTEVASGSPLATP